MCTGQSLWTDAHTCIIHQDRELSITAESYLVSFSSQCLPSIPRAKHWFNSFHHRLGWPVLRLHISGLTVCTLLCLVSIAWHNVFEIHSCFVSIKSLLHFIVEQYSLYCINILQFLYLFLYGWKFIFPDLAIMNEVVMNICVYDFFGRLMLLLSVDYLGRMVGVYLCYGKMSNHHPKWLYHFIVCISYLLLLNTITTNLTVPNNTHLLSSSFHGSGVWAQLS